jgi:hypothetical protein
MVARIYANGAKKRIIKKGSQKEFLEIPLTRGECGIPVNE